jgi:hypothetical protein
MPGESPLSMMRAPTQRVRNPAAGRAGRRRLWLILVSIAIVAALAVLWIWLWNYAASVADRALAGWVERESALGHVYSCGSQTIGGFPLSIDVRCVDATAEIKNPPYMLKAAAVGFTAQVWHPTQLLGDIRGPATLAVSGQSPGWTADWTRARLILRGLPPEPEGVSVRLDRPHVDVAGAGNTIFKAERAEAQVGVVGGSAHDYPVIEVSIHLAGAAAPILHPLLADPVEIELNARLSGFKDFAPKPWAERAREMHAANGGIEVKSLRIARSKIIVVGTGTLSVNAHGKFDGLIRVAIVGIEQLVPMIGIDRLIGQGIDRLVGSPGTTQGPSALDRLIPGLSGALRESANASLVENLKKMGEPTAIDGQPAIVLPLRFVDSSVYLGMLRVGELPPLF